MKRYAHITGWGKYAPEKILTNDDLSQMVDTSDEWIRTRTGIKTRHIVGEGETTATMSVRAAQAALDVANVTPDQIELIIVATSSPDYLTPSTACLVQNSLGAMRAGAFDLAAGCSGFVYGLGVASALIESGVYDTVLVIGAETVSNFVNWSDRETCVLFGDGAGAVVLQAKEVPGGVLSFVLGADGSGAELLYVPAGGTRQPTSAETVAQGLHFLRMNGRAVFRFAVNIMPRASRQVCEQAGLSLDDIELFIPHQANDRILQASARALNIPTERMFSNLEHYGNTSAASVPIALCEAIEAGLIKRGDHLVMVGFGAGLTWAAAAIQWSMPWPVPGRPWWRKLLRWLYYRWASLRSWTLRVLRGFDSTLRQSEEESQPPKQEKEDAMK
ncbi:MAG: ketoacyl-ACP synthase III [Anaerolineae bacterium]|nr:ketoacyl-ACP synthase III [Anaerolineae bacterium]